MDGFFGVFSLTSSPKKQMIDCDISQLFPIDMGHIIGPCSQKTGPLFDLIADVTVFNRRDGIVWFHSLFFLFFF